MAADGALPDISVTQHFARWALSLRLGDVPDAVREKASGSVLDVAGLCASARRLDYMQMVRESWDAEGPCTAIGHERAMDAAGAAFVNGTAAHGEDYDDTFEGTPVHTGTVMVPAILAVAERFDLSGADCLRGMAAGTELMCRMALTAPMAMHRAGFHPTAIIGALGAAAGCGVALRLSEQQLVDALGIAGSFASGIIEYLAEGSWTKRIHAGWAAQNGVRAALLAKHGFLGPRTVMEGQHGFFFAFADHAIEPDYAKITDELGETWHAATVAFKPYACGTMTQPFIDCAIQLARDGLPLDRVSEISCNVGEGTVHRLWEPLSEKRAPSTDYSAKFSVPFCVAVGLVDQAAGLGQFTDERINDAQVLGLAAKVGYVIDPNDEYPRNYSGHVRATLDDGTVVEVRQPHMRGGAREPIARDELESKFRANCAFGGWDAARTDALLSFCNGLFDAPNLADLAGFRG